jgi:prepilin-type processing-associated H-X9-DG protein
VFPSEVNGAFGANGCCRIDDVKDGTSNTLLLGEVAGKGPGTHEAFFWAGGNMLTTLEGINGPHTSVGGTWPTNGMSFYATGFGSWHPGGCNFVLADGSVTFISQNVGQNVLRALTTRDGKGKGTGAPDDVLISGPP